MVGKHTGATSLTSTRGASVLLVAAALLAAVPTAITTTQATLEVTDNVNFEGHTTFHGQDQALVTVQTKHAVTINLTAERLHLHTHWQKGEKPPVPLVPGHIVRDEGHLHANETDVNLTAVAWDGPSQALAIPTQAALDASAEGESHQALHPPSKPLASAGYTNHETVGPDQDPPGYEATLDEATPAHHRLDQATLEGDFNLFLHNLTLHIDPDEGTAWDHWTGYRANEDGATGSYELRVTRLHVEGGTLDIRASDALSLVHQELTATHRGHIGLAAASGLLHVDGRAIHLADDRVQLQGEGTAHLGKGTPPTPLELSVEGDYEPILQAASPQTPKQGLPLALLLLAALPATVPLLHRYPYPLRWLPSPAKGLLLDRWLANARHQHRHGATENARGLYDRLLILAPANRDAWRGKILLEHSEDPKQALKALQAAKRRLDLYPVELLELEILAAHDARLDGYAKKKLLRLAEQDPHHARRLLDDLPLPRLETDPDIRKALDAPRGTDEGRDPAYA